MDFHPSKIQIEKTFDVKDEKDASAAAEEIVQLGFSDKKTGFKVLMPKEQKSAKGITYGLKQTKQESNIRYWTYHHDKEHYAIVLVSSKVFEELGY